MPGICRYPAKRTGHTVNQGGTADCAVLISTMSALDRKYIFVKGVFYLYWI